MSAPGATVTLHDGLVLLAPGGLYIPDERALVVSDLHVGYTPTLRARGYAVPRTADDELLGRVRAMLAATSAERLVVAGDFVHGEGSTRANGREPSSLERFVHALAPCALTIVRGNHDRRGLTAMARLGLEATTLCVLGRHLVHHGDVPDDVRAARARAKTQGGRAIIGHLHPALALDDGLGARAVVPAFVTAAGLLCLPALSPFARGGDVRSGALRAQLAALVDDDAMGVAAAVAGRVVAVGNVFEKRRGT